MEGKGYLMDTIIKTAVCRSDAKHQQPERDSIFPKNKDYNKNHSIDFKAIHIQELETSLTVSLDFFSMAW